MKELTLQEMEATRGGFFNHIAATIGNTATAVNVAALIASANGTGAGASVLQSASANAGNIIASA